ncbi:MAG: response regulator transcription factor [Treponema sp.]|nr:response regulator transcription factor [Treponema sp.]
MRSIRIVMISVSEPEQSRIYAHLSSQKDIEITGIGRDGYDAVKLAELYQPDVVLVDQQITNIDRPGLIALIKRKSPAAAVIMHNSRDDDEYISKALSNGVSGYLLKDTEAEKMAESIRTVYHGGCYLNTEIQTRSFRLLSKVVIYRKMFHNLPPPRKSNVALPPSVSQTEWQIMSFIGQGRSNKEIAETLRLKPGTVRNYLSSAMHKTGLRNRIQVALYALRYDLLNSAEK